MKKKFVRVMLFGALALSTIGYVGCKDYDDDIDRLEQKIAENANAIKEINDLIKAGSVITKVEPITGGIEVTLSNGKTFTITNGKDGTNGTDGTNGAKWEIGKDDFWYRDGVKTEFKAKGDKGDQGDKGEPGNSGTGTSGKDGATYIPGEDGYWYKNEVKPENKTDLKWTIPGVVCVADMGDYYLFSNLRNADGTAGSAKINKYSASFVASLVHIESNYDPMMGDVIFLPVIGTDWTSGNAQKTYEYNLTNQEYATTLVNGWAKYEYHVNPASVDPKNYEALGFIEQAVTTARNNAVPAVRSTPTGLPTWKIDSQDAGKLVIKASAKGFNMVKQDQQFDDPNGKPYQELSQYGEVGKVNKLAFKIKNVNSEEKLINDGEVTSNYVATKRMVVPQEDVMIGIAVNDNLNLDQTVTSPNFTDLSQMYEEQSDATQRNTYKTNIPVSANILYTSKPKLDDFVKDYALQFYTNTGFASNNNVYGRVANIDNNRLGQWRLGALGFENIDFKYYLEGYSLAEVDQTKRYLKIDEETGTLEVLPDATGKPQTAAINREPIIKIKMFVDGVHVMSKLLKIKLTETGQMSDDFINKDLTDQTLGCTPLVGGEHLAKQSTYVNATIVNGLKIDFDQYFNKLGVSKDKFVELYSPAGITGIASITSVKKDGLNFLDWSYDASNTANLTIDYSDIFGNATFDNNYIYIGLKNQLRAGTYTIKFAFETQSSIAAYKSFTITAEFKINDPKATWSYNPSMWEGTSNMLAYGIPTSENNTVNPFVGPFIMTAAIEDGFNKYNKSGNCDVACFELVKSYSNSEVTLTYVGGKHMLTIAPYNSKWVEQKIRVRAVTYIDGMVGNALDKTKRRIKATVDATGSDEFDVVFRNPVSYAETNNGSWYLVDKAADNMNEGSYLPVYRLFKLWDTHKEQTNGMMWDPALANGWFVRSGLNIGQSLYTMHNVSVGYQLLPANNQPYVLSHATITDKGVLRWSNAQGDAVVNDQPIVVTVTVTHNWNRNNPIVKDIKVNVKRANTSYTMPALGFLNNNTTDGLK